MKKLTLTIMTAALFAACGPKQAELTSGIDLNNLDTTVSPCDDFYQYACGGWMNNNPLDAEHSRYGSFDKLGEENQQQLRTLVEEVSSQQNDKGSVADKIATLYNIAMDSATLQQQGATPIQPLMQQIANLKSRDEVIASLASLHTQGIYPFFVVFNEADPNDSEMQIAWIYQTGLGMGDRDYYLEQNDVNKALRQSYATMIATEMQLSGYDKLCNTKPEQLATMVIAFEEKLAATQYDRITNRDPQKTTNKMTLGHADSLAPLFGFSKHFDAMEISGTKFVNMGQPGYFEKASQLIAKTDAATLKAYVAAVALRTAAPYLSDDFVNANFNFYGKAKSGLEKNKPRWKRAISTVDGALGEALGQLYVAKYFPPQAKERMVTLVANLKEAFGQRIDAASWMDPDTKVKAHEKLDAIDTKIGYPDKWRDYGGLDIKADSYWQNIVRSNIFDTKYMVGKINKPTDHSEWGMTPQTVNAYYNPTSNEICFPAGILQPPFFDMNADDAVNYGAIGMVIGHEMTHGFDDQGHQYDKSGNLANWWKESDSANFANNAQVLVDHFNNIKVLDHPETFATGQFTFGENIADNGGLHISFQAMQNAIAKGQVNNEKMDGFTAPQRFFLAYARVWANNIRKEEILKRTMDDVHSLGRWRVNGTVPHLDEFLQAWNIQPNNGMYLAPEKRVTLW